MILHQLQLGLKVFDLQTEYVTDLHWLCLFCRLSEYVTDRSQSVDIVNLLLPFLGRRLKRSEEFEVNLLTCMKNLIGNCEMPAQLIPYVMSMFCI